MRADAVLGLASGDGCALRVGEVDGPRLCGIVYDVGEVERPSGVRVGLVGGLGSVPRLDVGLVVGGEGADECLHAATLSSVGDSGRLWFRRPVRRLGLRPRGPKADRAESKLAAPAPVRWPVLQVGVRTETGLLPPSRENAARFPMLPRVPRRFAFPSGA